MNPKPLTPKQQLYVDARVRGLGPSDAYREAYNATGSPSTCAGNAKKVEAKPAVQEAIGAALEEAKKQRTMSAIVDRDYLLKKLEAASIMGMETHKSISAAVSAMALMARLQGLDKQIIENKTTATVEVTTPEARAALVAKLKGRAKK